MTQPSTDSRHPKGLFVLFFTEMWERFSFYGMRALLVLYVINGLLFDDAYANSGVYGSYTGLVYLTPLLGGYFADQFWGNRRSIVTGGFLMGIGQLIMFTSASFYENVSLAHTLMWVGLTTIIIGNGFFKPNISSLVGQLYPKGDRRLDAAYTIFYMGINLGAFIGPLICGIVGNQYDDAGNAIRGAFKWGFLAAGIAMFTGTLFFIWLRNKYVIDPNGNGLGILPNKLASSEAHQRESTRSSLKSVGVWVAIGIALFLFFRFVSGLDYIGSFIFSSAIAISGLIVSDKSLTKNERARVIVIFISAFFVIFFWATFEQAASSLTLFAERNTDRTAVISTLLGNVILFVIAFAALLYYILQRLMLIPVELKRVFGALAAGAVGYAIYHYIIGTPFDMKEVPPAWFNSVNGLFIILLAPILSQVWIGLGKAGLEPSSPKKQSLGLLFLSLGYLIIAFGVKGDVQKASMMWLVTLYFMHTVGELCLSPIGLSLVNKLAPARFSSILMGVWFLSNAAGNKFAGTLGALYPGKGPTNFAGFKIETLYDFFMVFVIISGIAAALLFVLTYWMEKRMTEQ